MAGRGKVSLYMIFLVMAFGTIGLVSFQILKERKNSTILLVAKYKEIENLNNQYEELLEATKKSLLQAKEDKDNLNRKVEDLENDDKKYHTLCKEDKEKYKIENYKEITNLKEMLQAKNIELMNTNAKVELLKLDNKKDEAKMVINTVDKDNFLKEGLESFLKTTNIKDKNSKNSLSQKATKEEKINDGESIINDRDIVSRTLVEDTKANINFEVDKINTTNLQENEFATSKVVGEEDDAKELEVDMKLSDFDVEGETNESLLQE